MYLAGFIYIIWLPIFYTKKYIEERNKFDIKHVLCIINDKIVSKRKYVDKMNDNGRLNIMTDLCHITYTYRGETYKHFCTGKPKFLYPKIWKKCTIKNVHSINMKMDGVEDITKIFKMYMGPHNTKIKFPNKLFNSKQIILEHNDGSFTNLM